MKDFFFTLDKYSLFMISLILFIAKVLSVGYYFDSFTTLMKISFILGITSLNESNSI